MWFLSKTNKPAQPSPPPANPTAQVTAPAANPTTPQPKPATPQPPAQDDDAQKPSAVDEVPAKPRTAPSSGGGMFGGLAVKQPARPPSSPGSRQATPPTDVAETTTVSADTAAAKPTKQAGMFDMLSVKTSTPPPLASSTASPRSAAGPPPTPPASAATDAVSNPPEASDKNPLAPPQPTDNGGASAFSFMGSEKPPAKPEVSTPPPTSFGFMKTQDNATPPGEPTSFGFLKSSASANSLSAQSIVNETTVDLLSGVNTVQPARNIKKKRTGKVPAFARRPSGSTNSSVRDDTPSAGSEEPVGLLKPSPAVPASSNGGDNNALSSTEAVAQPEGGSPSEAPTPSLEEHPTDEPPTKFPDTSDVNDQTDGRSKLAVDGGATERPKDPVVVGAGAPKSMFEGMTSRAPSSADVSKPSKSASVPKSIKPAKKGPQDESERILLEFRADAEKLSKELKDIDGNVAASTKEAELLENKLEYLQTQLASSEEQQEQATIDEDFESAERLQQAIDSATRDINIVESNLHRIGLERETMKKRKIALFDRELVCVEGVTKQLGNFSETKRKEADAFVEATLHTYNQQRLELDEEEEMLALDKENVTKDLSTIVKEKSIITEKIDGRTTKLREAREEWAAKLGKVDAEIEELLKQLQEKQAVKEEFESEIAVLDDHIKSIRSKFGTRLDELNERESAVNEKEAVINSNAAAQKEISEKLDAQKAQGLEQGEAMHASAQAVDEQLVVVQDMIKRLQADQQGRKAHSLDSNNDEEELAKMKDDVLISRQQVEMLEAKILQSESAMMEKRRSLIDIDTIVPGLNEQKKMAVSTRKFKEAGAITAKIKEMTAKRDELQVGYQELEENLNKDTCSRDEKKALQSKLQQEIKAREMGLNSERLESIQEKRLQLAMQMQSIRASEGAEIAGNMSFGGTLLLLLQAEADSCELEAMDLANKLGDPGLAHLKLPETLEPVDKQEADVAVDTSATAVEDTPAVVQETLDVEEAVKEGAHDVPNGGVSAEVQKWAVRVAEIDGLCSDIEADIDKAIEEDLFDLAEELDGKLQELKAEREDLVARCGGEDAVVEARNAKVCDVPGDVDDTEAGSNGDDVDVPDDADDAEVGSNGDVSDDAKEGDEIDGESEGIDRESGDADQADAVVAESDEVDGDQEVGSQAEGGGDGQVDGAEDAQVDAVDDAQVDATEDAQVDATDDAQVDATEDAQVDATEDAQVDATDDAQVDDVIQAKAPANDSFQSTVEEIAVELANDAILTALDDVVRRCATEE